MQKAARKPASSKALALSDADVETATDSEEAPPASSGKASRGPGPYFGTANSTAERAIDILLLFTDDKPFWTAQEIAAHFTMPKSTVYRYVNSLRSYALIDEDGQGAFRLGPRVFPLARTAKSGMPAVRVAMPHIKKLAEQFGEMVVLQQRVGYDILALERIQSPQRVNLASTRSHILPWPATSSAKILLAFATPPEQEDIFRVLQPTGYTGSTIASKSALRVTLDQIRRSGYATTDEERDEGVWGAAAPVFERGLAQYSVAIAAPKFRMNREKMDQIIKAVIETAAATTRDLAAFDF